MIIAVDGPAASGKGTIARALAERQRDFAAQDGGAVLDGRDIGTIIAPKADAKLFVTAAPEVRARRRFEELNRMGLSVHYEDVLLDIQARDERDSHRAAAPLVKAEDAILLDTSAMGRDEAVAAAVAAVDRRLAAAGP